ncbi:ImpA family type VI secretion system protein [Vibrio barjaei]|jgi:type VI secretion system protein ImpA|uniref:type VI secretion system protein TssA n=1 Tax=Vibrio barjaei TaxID=1676683 RepID=UPI0007BADF1B|nr:type VI secretion system ImpA family N-terminal domain-containing protein [Vibrio barjaei]MCY9873351.1 type VI secretion system ImpA family N-terminal domain-containing protein [Vibrio barjaei]OIN25670.1 hypothetical protein AWH66_2015450 [Vibrio barjaei]
MYSFDDLSGALSEDAPSGQYLKLDRGEYRAIRNGYNTALSSFRQMLEAPDAFADEEKSELNAQNWQQFREQLNEALGSKTKDTELWSWYITSLSFDREPIPKLIEGFKLLQNYIDNFWDTLHPTLPDNKVKATDEPGKQKELVEFRIKPLSQFIGDAPEASALFMPTQFIPLVGDITYSRYFQAERSGTLSDLQNEANDAFSLECTDLILSLGQLVEQVNQVEIVLSERCQSDGVQALSFKFVREIFESHLTALRTLVGNQYNQWPLDEKHSEAASDETQSKPDNSEPSDANDNIDSVSSNPDTVSLPDATPNKAPVSPPPISATVSTISTQPLTRDAAYNQLRTLADFFKQTEPHNPTSYLLERAIVWGQLPLPELMKILVGNNSNALNQIDSLIGMNDTPINMENNSLSTQSGGHSQQYTESPTSNSDDAESSASNQSNNNEVTQATANSDVSDFEW